MDEARLEAARLQLSQVLSQEVLDAALRPEARVYIQRPNGRDSHGPWPLPWRYQVPAAASQPASQWPASL